MLLFQSEEWIDKWCKRNGLKRGETLTINQVWDLSKLWYHNRLSIDYHGRTLADVQAIFKQLELTSAFWQSNADLNAPQK